MLDFFKRIIRTRLGLAGAVLTTASGFLVVLFFVLGMAGLEESPYIGVFAYLVLPALFVIGLLLIPLGLLARAPTPPAAHGRASRCSGLRPERAQHRAAGCFSSSASPPSTW